MSFKEEQTKRVETIEEILKKYLPEQEGHQKVIMDAMEYSVMAGGKDCVRCFFGKCTVCLAVRMKKQ